MADRSDGREHLLRSAYACIARTGLAKTTVEDVARESGRSRATIYRYFPGGRDELLEAVIVWEVDRFFARLGRAAAGATSLADVLVEGLLFAHRALVEHIVLQSVLRSEPQLLVPRITAEANRLQPEVMAFLLPFVGAEAVHRRLRPGIEPVAAADFLSRMVLSFINAPGRWDLEDEGEVRRLVGSLLAGVVVGG